MSDPIYIQPVEITAPQPVETPQSKQADYCGSLFQQENNNDFSFDSQAALDILNRWPA